MGTVFVHLLFELMQWMAIFFIAVGGFAFFPWHILLLLGLFRIKKAAHKAGSLENPRFLFQITTIGTNPESTQAVINSIHHAVSDYPYKIWVVTEPDDPHQYNEAEKIVVPKQYTSPNQSTDKTRALHYASQLRKKRGLTEDQRWIVFLDDDTRFTQAYFREILKIDPKSVGAQGMVSVRHDYGEHLLSSLADNIRPADCISFCSLCNRQGTPMLTHGEGLVVRSDIEKEIGWDFGDVLSEDFLFGRQLARMFPGRFEWLNASIEGKSPLCWDDFTTQRRRWLWGAIEAVPRIQRKAVFFVMIRYAVTFLGMISLTLGTLNYFFPLGLSLPYPVSMFLLLNMGGVVAYYQVGCYFNTKHLDRWARVKYHILMFLSQYLVYFYEVSAFLYGFLQRKPESFQVIEKN